MDLVEFVTKLRTISKDIVCGFEKKGVVNITINKISFVFGRYLIDANDEHGERIIICFFDRNYDRDVIKTWEDVFLVNATNYMLCRNFLFGFLVSDFKYKNTKAFQVKLMNCVKNQGALLKVMERCLLKIQT